MSSWFAAALAWTVLAGPALGQDRLKVVATFSILADMARQVGGDLVDVRALVGPDGDAHVHEPSPSDARAVAASRLLVMNGLGFEGWLPRLFQASGYRGPVVVASEGATRRDGSATVDPHAWQNLANGRIYARNIAAALAAADPANAAIYGERAARYIERLDALDAWVRAEIAAVPAPRRKVVTSHDAFGHFAAAYGVTFLTPAGLTTGGEPTARGVARLIDRIKRDGIRVLFVENMSNPRTLERIAAETGAVLGERLYPDALSPPGGRADSYETMFRHNVAAMVAGMTAR